MFEWDNWFLRIVGYYGHLIGVINFESEYSTGRVFKTQRSTLYALTINVLVTILLVVDMTGRTRFNTIFGKSNQLHEYVVLMMIGLRISAGLSTLINRWRLRSQMIKFARSLFRLYLERPQAERIMRRGFFLKFLLGFIADILQVAISLGPGGHLHPKDLLGMSLNFGVSAIISFTIAQYNLVMMLIWANYQMLNKELRKVIDESRELSYHYPHNGVFMCRCCNLADQLDNIGRLQSELQDLVDRLGELFGIQGVIVFGEYYIFSVATNYLGLSILRHGYEKLGMTLWSLALSFIWSIFYYTDGIFNLFVVFKTYKEHQKMMYLLSERTLFAPGLDARLEESFENIQIQLIRNPFQIKLFNMFVVDRISTTSMIVSVLTHSIYLVQYEMENF
ncbi:hypothetical protein KR009_001812 [Drosophila setifemur]|nr:hypothetical protein KR009_001812 [Drosophila setifemur]